MALNEVLKHIDDEIARLQHARELLAGSSTESVTKPASEKTRTKRKASTTAQSENQPKRKRNLSPEGRKAIADAMKKRWAARRNTETAA